MSGIGLYNVDFISFIPAKTGFFVLVTRSDEHGYPVDFDKYPVLCWGVQSEVFTPLAITIQGPHPENPYILEPSGLVRRYDDIGFFSCAEWIASERADYAEKQGRRK